MKHSKKVWYAPNKHEAYGEEEIKAVEQCLRDGWLAGFGPRSVEFEEKIAKELKSNKETIRQLIISSKNKLNSEKNFN